MTDLEPIYEALYHFPVVISLVHTSQLPVLPQPTNTTHSTKTYVHKRKQKLIKEY